MDFLVTGGAGFIGSHLTASLLKDGHRVTVIDNFSTGSMDNLAPLERMGGLTVVHGDVVLEPELAAELVRKAGCVVHLAAAVGVELVVHDPVRTIMTNIRGTENILRPAAEYGKRIIIASTSEVYGKSGKNFFSETDDLLIGNPVRSRWSYACSKLMDEFLLMAYHKQNGLPGTVVRFFNTVGPGQTGRYGMVVPRFTGAALRGEALKVYGDGTQTRCFCHVSDVVRALRLLLPCRESYGRIFNIGSQRSISIEALARLVIQRTGSSSVIEKIPYEQAYENGFEDMMHRAPDISAVSSAVNWHPERSLEEIIDDVAAALKD